MPTCGANSGHCGCRRILVCAGTGAVLVSGGTVPMRAYERPSRCLLAECVREGRVARGGAVLTVGVDAARVEDRLVGGELGCPGCGGSLRPWGWARTRVLRGAGGSVVVRPRRSRCGECGGSHVLLPVFALLRRADAVGVIGAALAARAAGVGARRAAAVVGRPIETVRGWLRCFAHRAEVVRVVFTALLVGVGVDPVPPAAMSSAFADAVAAVVGASAAVRSRWPDVGELPPWALASAVTGGRLLAPGWP
jgi:hypothetical protein